MKQYIDKDALVALIKKIYNEDYKFLPSDIVEGIQDFKDDVLRNIDDLEVKEVVAEQEGTCNGILNIIIGKTWHIKIPLDKAGLKHGDRVKIFIVKGE